MAPKRLILSPGAQKTATSLLQAMLESHREALEARGVALARQQAYYKSGMRQVLQTKDGAGRPNKSVWWQICNTVFGPGWEQSDVVTNSIENMLRELESPVSPSGANRMHSAVRLLTHNEIELPHYSDRQHSLIKSAIVEKIQTIQTENGNGAIKRRKHTRLDWITSLKLIYKIKKWLDCLKIMKSEHEKQSASVYINISLLTAG